MEMRIVNNSVETRNTITKNAIRDLIELDNKRNNINQINLDTMKTNSIYELLDFFKQLHQPATKTIHSHIYPNFIKQIYNHLSKRTDLDIYFIEKHFNNLNFNHILLYSNNLTYSFILKYNRDYIWENLSNNKNLKIRFISKLWRLKYNKDKFFLSINAIGIFVTIILKIEVPGIVIKKLYAIIGICIYIFLSLWDGKIYSYNESMEEEIGEDIEIEVEEIGEEDIEIEVEIN